MKHHSQQLALAGALTAGIWYSICAALLMFAQPFALKIHAHMMHMDNLDMFASHISLTPAGFLTGLAGVMLSAYLALLLFSCIYCYLCCSMDPNAGMGGMSGKGGCGPNNCR
jgi:hypothetical protein